MKNKIWYIFIGIALIGMCFFYYVRWEKGGFSEIIKTKIPQSSYLIHGVHLKGSYNNEADGELVSTIERKLSQELNQETISCFYYVNPTRDNHSAFDLFMGVEVKDATVSLVDTFETRKIDFGLSIKGYQKCDPQFNSIPRDLQEYAEKEGLKLKKDSIFEQYNSDHIFMHMIVESN